MIAENGVILAESTRFVNGTIYADLDIRRLENERRRMTTFCFSSDDEDGEKEPFYNTAEFSLEKEETVLTRKFDSRPFVPSAKEERDRRCNEILNIQAMGLKKDWHIFIVRMR